MSDVVHGRDNRSSSRVDRPPVLAVGTGVNNVRQPEDEAVVLLREVHAMVRGLETILKKEKAKEWYTTEEAAEHLEVSAHTIRRYIRIGQLQACRVTGAGSKGRHLISREVLLAALKGRSKEQDGI